MLAVTLALCLPSLVLSASDSSGSPPVSPFREMELEKRELARGRQEQLLSNIKHKRDIIVMKLKKLRSNNDNSAMAQKYSKLEKQINAEITKIEKRINARTPEDHTQTNRIQSVSRPLASPVSSDSAINSKPVSDTFLVKFMINDGDENKFNAAKAFSDAYDGKIIVLYDNEGRPNGLSLAIKVTQGSEEKFLRVASFHARAIMSLNHITFESTRTTGIALVIDNKGERVTFIFKQIGEKPMNRLLSDEDKYNNVKTCVENMLKHQNITFVNRRETHNERQVFWRTHNELFSWKRCYPVHYKCTKMIKQMIVRRDVTKPSSVKFINSYHDFHYKLIGIMLKEVQPNYSKAKAVGKMFAAPIMALGLVKQGHA